MLGSSEHTSQYGKGDRTCQNMCIKSDTAGSTCNSGVNLSIVFHQQALKTKGKL